jgi:hypothetical protein
MQHIFLKTSHNFLWKYFEKTCAYFFNQVCRLTYYLQKNKKNKKKLERGGCTTTPTEERGGLAAASILVGVGVAAWAVLQ